MTDDDAIEALLRASGRRPVVAADRAARVREAARRSWTEETRRRPLHLHGLRNGALKVAAVVLVVAIIAVIDRLPSQPSGVRVERVSKTVLTRQGLLARFRSGLPLQAGLMVGRGDLLRTEGDARAALRLPSGHSVRLDTDTSLRVLSGNALVLQHGGVYVDAHRERGASTASIRIETPLGTVEDEGTQFEARLDTGGALILRVREGLVALERSAGRLEAHAGEAVVIDGSGTVQRTDEPGDGDAWRWVEAIAPMMEIEGKSLKEFLDWIVRERGVELRYADAGLEERAPAIVLKGSISGMTLDEATASVLATCGLSPRWESGALVVSAEPGPQHSR